MFTEHAQNLLGCEKCDLRKAVGNFEMPSGCEISIIVQEGLITCYPSDLMKSTVVDESLSSIQLQFCVRENQLATINPTE